MFDFRTSGHVRICICTYIVPLFSVDKFAGEHTLVHLFQYLTGRAVDTHSPLQREDLLVVEGDLHLVVQWNLGMRVYQIENGDTRNSVTCNHYC